MSAMSCGGAGAGAGAGGGGGGGAVEMYSEVALVSVAEGGAGAGAEGGGVLGALGAGGGGALAALVRAVAGALAGSARLETAAQTEWALAVVGAGLALPLREQEALRECVRVVCAWLAPLAPCAPAPQHPPPPPLPAPLAAHPHRYAALILPMLHNLFVPRTDANDDLVGKHAMLCHRVLRLWGALGAGGALHAAQWRALLLAALAAARAVLAPPLHAPSTAAAAPAAPAAPAQLQERVASTLVELWALACHQHFPPPPLWRTLRHHALTWRHRAPLVQQWARLVRALTHRLVRVAYGAGAGAGAGAGPGSYADEQLVGELGAEGAAHAWWRWLHTLGSPADLCRPARLTYAPPAHAAAVPSTEPAPAPSPSPPTSQPPPPPCMPQIFLTAMLALADVVDTFLAVRTESGARVKVNSVLHVVGEWLFEAALPDPAPAANANTVTATATATATANAGSGETENEALSFHEGRAVAVGALCRVACAGAGWGSGGSVGGGAGAGAGAGGEGAAGLSAVYRARLLHVLHHAYADPRVAPTALVHARHLFRAHLPAALLLLHDVMLALQRALLPPATAHPAPPPPADLPAAALSTLLSLLPFPTLYARLRVPQLPPLPPLPDDWPARLTKLALAAAHHHTRRASPLAHQFLPVLTITVAHADAPGARAPPPPPPRTEHAAPAHACEPLACAISCLCAALHPPDTKLTLAALETLSSLPAVCSARPPLAYAEHVTHALCEYVSSACARPPPEHSRDLHSCLVAAYECLAAWLSDELVGSATARGALLRCVEVGMAGPQASGARHERELRPVSLRVREAAESVLALALHLSAPPCRLTERELAAHAHSAPPPRHYLVDGHLLLTLVECGVGNSQEAQPQLTVVARSAWGRYAWSLGLRGAPRCASGAPPALAHATRPVTICEAGEARPPVCRPLAPPPPCPLDAALPSLESVAHALGEGEGGALLQLLADAVCHERAAAAAAGAQPAHLEAGECVPPPPATDIQTARLFLGAAGYLAGGGGGGGGVGGAARLVALESGRAGWAAALARLDACSARPHCTVRLVACRAHQRSAADMVRNSLRAATVPPAFLRLLAALGRARDARSHHGWCGRPHPDPAAPTTAAATAAPATAKTPSDPPTHGGAIYNGHEQLIYWEDNTVEVAFLVPSSLEEEAAGANGGGSEAGAGAGGRLLVVWCERAEDGAHLPLEELGGGGGGGGEQGCLWLWEGAGGVVYLGGEAGGLGGAAVAWAALGALVRGCAGALGRRAARLDLGLARRRHLLQHLADGYARAQPAPHTLRDMFDPPQPH